MAVKIRLARRGRRKAPFYHLVIADARAPRDGKFIEKIGSYNPMTSPAVIEVENEKAIEWLQKGAKPTYTASAILRYSGVLYRMHLLNGVKKGAMTIEKADELYDAHLNSKSEKIAERAAETKAKKEATRKAISGVAKKAPAAVPAEESAQAAFQENDAPVAKSSEEE